MSMYGKTHIKCFFFSGRITKGVRRVNLPDHGAKKNTFFSLKSGCYSRKTGKKKKKMSKIRNWLILLRED